MSTPQSHRPRVTVKYAQTLDGRIATSSRDGARRISSPPSLELAHRLRAEHQGIMVGVQTVIADDPLLTVRLVEGPSPRRVVADSTLRIPLTAALLNDGSPERTIIAHTSRADKSRIQAVRERGAETLEIEQDERGRVRLESLLKALRKRGFETLMVEGGAAVITELMRRKLVDRLVICVAPKIVGRGVDAIGDLGITRLADALTFQRLTVTQVGDDVVFDGEIAGEVATAGLGGRLQS